MKGNWNMSFVNILPIAAIFCGFLLVVFVVVAVYYINICDHEYKCVNFRNYIDHSYGSQAPSTISTHQCQKCGKIVKPLFYGGGYLTQEQLDKIKDQKPCNL